MTQDEFEEHRDAVLTRVSEKDKNLYDEFKRYWGREFGTHKYNFDRQAQEMEMLDELELEEFQAHFAKLFESATARRLDIHWNSTPHKEQEEIA